MGFKERFGIENPEGDWPELKKSPRIEDYLLPVPIKRFSDDIPIPIVQESQSADKPTKQAIEIAKSTEAYHVLKFLIEESEEKRVRIEHHSNRADGYIDGFPEDTIALTVFGIVRAETLTSEKYTFQMGEFDNREAISMDVVVPLNYSRHEDKRLMEMRLYLQDGLIKLNPTESKDSLDYLGSQRGFWTPLNSETWEKDQSKSDIDTVIFWFSHLYWNKLAWQLIRRENDLDFDNPNDNYYLKEFGQSFLWNDSENTGFRLIDDTFQGRTVKTPAEVVKELTLTKEDVKKKEKARNDFEKRWKTEIAPKLTEWSEDQVESSAEYLRENQRDAIEVIKDQFEKGKRLILLGSYIHPLSDDLIPRLLNEIDAIDFVVIEENSPAEGKKGSDPKTMVSIPGKVTMEIPLEDARKNYPGQFKDPDKTDHALDSIIAKARLKDIEILYAGKSADYKDSSKNISKKVSEYLRENPDKKGIYVASLLNSLKWPGHPRRAKTVPFNRPLASLYSFSSSNDTSVKTPGGKLSEEFGDQISSIVQFAMPQGFGLDWRNLRGAIAASGIEKRFAITDIANGPFAEQHYLQQIFVELGDIPLEDAWEYLGLVNYIFVDWGKLVDGAVIYPSDKPLPEPVSQEEMIEESAKILGEMLKEDPKN